MGYQCRGPQEQRLVPALTRHGPAFLRVALKKVRAGGGGGKVGPGGSISPAGGRVTIRSWCRVLSIMVAGCAPVSAVPTPTAQRFTVKLPELVQVNPATHNQERDGIRMVVTPEPFRVERALQHSFRAVPVMLALGTTRPVDRRIVSSPSILPDQLRFNVRISNRLARVVRLSGTVLSFQVAGKSVNVPQDRNTEFLSGIILPQQEVELDVIGPALADIVGEQMDQLPGDTATVGLLMFDIVTATDQAGNPTRRSNFEFYYRFRMPQRPDSVTTTVTRLTLPQAWSARIWGLQQGDANRWVRVPELECLPNCA